MKPVRLMKPHPAAALFPLLSDAELRELVEDIRAHGVRAPVVTFRGELLDGRNRIRACDLLGLNPPSVEYGGADPVAFVISANLRRRHMDDGQRAMVAAKLAKLRDGQRADQAAQICAAATDEVVAPVITQSQAADLLGVSRRTVQHAREVLDRGAPELVAAVERGEASVSAAATVANLPVAEQVDAVQSGKVAAVAKQARKPMVIDGEARREPEAAEGAGEGVQLPTPQPNADRATAPPAVKPAGPSRSRRTDRDPAPDADVAGYDERAAEVDDLRGAVEALTTENERLLSENTELRQSIALANLPADEALTAKDVIDGLRSEIEATRADLNTATVTLRATTASRDQLLSENAQLKRQCAAQRREIERLGGGRRGAP